MALVQVDIVHLESLQRCVQLFLDLLARQAAIRAIHGKKQLGRKYIGFPLDPGQSLTEHRLGRSAAVDIRGIEEIDSEIERTMDAGDRYLLALGIGEGQPRAEAN